MKDTNKTVLLMLLLGVNFVLLLVLLSSNSYAFLKAKVDKESVTNVNMSASTLDHLTFDNDADINLIVNSDNYFNSNNDVVSSINAKAKLIANNETNSATNMYNGYFQIIKNQFTYTLNSNNPDMILKITDPSGNVVKFVDGLEYNELFNGFDITQKEGIFKFADNYIISSDSSVVWNEQVWNITIILKNYNNSNKLVNEGKSFSSKVILGSEIYSK